MAYRGRVLVQLSTQLDGEVDKAVDAIPTDDILVTQVGKEAPPSQSVGSRCQLALDIALGASSVWLSALDVRSLCQQWVSAQSGCQLWLSAHSGF